MPVCPCARVPVAAQSRRDPSAPPALRPPLASSPADRRRDRSTEPREEERGVFSSALPTTISPPSFGQSAIPKRDTEPLPDAQQRRSGFCGPAAPGRRYRAVPSARCPPDPGPPRPRSPLTFLNDGLVRDVDAGVFYVLQHNERRRSASAPGAESRPTAPGPASIPASLLPSLPSASPRRGRGTKERPQPGARGRSDGASRAPPGGLPPLCARRWGSLATCRGSQTK